VRRSILAKAFRKLLKAKAETGLTYPGLLLYAAMVYLLMYRWVRPAVLVGRILQRTSEANYWVNSVLANAYRQESNFKEECRTLMAIVPANCKDIALLHRAGETAAFAGDADTLKRLREIAAGVSPSFLHYLDGILAFRSDEQDYPVHFQKAVGAYFMQEGLDPADGDQATLSRLMKGAIGEGRPIPEFVRMAYNFRTLQSIDDLLVGQLSPSTSPAPIALSMPPDATRGSVDPVVLISCSYGYLTVFADYYISTLRRNNGNIIHLHVLAGDVGAAEEFLTGLAGRYTNVRYSIEPITDAPQTYFTLARFLVCRELMNQYGRDVHISDIDHNPDLDLSALGSELRSRGFDFGLCDAGYPVPWAKFSVGFSYFRFGNEATDVYLRLLSRYLKSLYADGGFFSMDQVGACQIYEYMKARNYQFRVMNLFPLIDFDRLCRVPKRLQSGKIRIKFGDGGPQ
jgi:hypothetical protein